MGLFSKFKKTKKTIKLFSDIVDTSSFKDLTPEQKFDKYVSIMQNNKKSHEDIKLAYYLLCESADAGYTASESELGYAFLIDVELDPDYDKALSYLKRASQKNDVKALWNLGFMYQNGLGVTKNYLESLEYYKMAAKLGMPDAFHQVGAFYYEGLGCTRDINEARKWFKKGCDANCISSLITLGNIYYNEEKDKESYELLLKAEKLGSKEASEFLKDSVYDKFR